MDQIFVDYLPLTMEGRFEFHGDDSNANWLRLQYYASNKASRPTGSNGVIQVPWVDALTIIRAVAPLQKKSGFRIVPASLHTKTLIQEFIRATKEYQTHRRGKPEDLNREQKEQLRSRLADRGFTRRELTDFQLRDLNHLLKLSNGANFSVPGAGKTTVTMALNCLLDDSITHQLVIGPKAAFPAWLEVIDECFDLGESAASKDLSFIALRSGDRQFAELLRSGHRRFVTNYEAFSNELELFRHFLSNNRVHLVLDESHRMKAGRESNRGAAILSISTLPARKDLLSGTPMPQSITDLESQMEFLWPGSGIGRLIHEAESPRSVVGGLYVRTKKHELGLKKPNIRYVNVPMAQGQLALYGVVRLEALKQLSSLKTRSNIDLASAKKSVMRLLQLSAVPAHALKSMMETDTALESGIVDQVLAEGYAPKVLKTVEIVQDLARRGRKTVVWTIFNETIQQLEFLLGDIGAVVINGSVRSGDSRDPNTREGRLQRFHKDNDCMVLIANPAAAGEGISLHTVCHDAVYLDRSFNSTHYLQSVDRIHRLGLPKDVDTNITILQSLAAPGLGSVDNSVKRRLASKIRAMQELLDDQDLRLLALDEEESDAPIDADMTFEDLMDLIVELEGKSPISSGQIDDFYT